MNPEQILAAMVEMYASCSTYRDTGRVTITWLRAGHTSIRPFETAFVRPDRFRFEFRAQHFDGCPWDRYLVWAGAGRVRTWWDVRPEEQESLGLALAGATGVSGGSAHKIPNLLMSEEVGGRRLTDLVELVSLGDAELGEVTCYRLQGRPRHYPVDPAEFERLRDEVFRETGHRLPWPTPSDRVLTLWIDRGTLLLRRIEEQDHFETDEQTGLRTHAIEQVTEYEPEVDVAITEEELCFDPPVSNQ